MYLNIYTCIYSELACCVQRMVDASRTPAKKARGIGPEPTPKGNVYLQIGDSLTQAAAACVLVYICRYGVYEN